MTSNDIIGPARAILQDTESDQYRWTDEFLSNALDDGVLFLHSVRPETRYVNGKLLDRVVLPADRNARIDINERYREALVYYVVYRAYLTDDTDTVNAQLAENYRTKAIQRMQT